MLELGSYYEVLGLDKTATSDQIKTAYRNLAHKYHPDKNDAPNANVFFRILQEAYETLSCPAKKQAYDERQNVDNKYGRTDVPQSPNVNKANKQKKKNVGQVMLLILKFLIKVILIIILPFLLFLKIITWILSEAGPYILSFIMLVGAIAGIIATITGNISWQRALVFFFVAGGISVAIGFLFVFLAERLDSLCDKISFFVRYR